MTNTNCLEDIKCPQCGNEDRLNIVARIMCRVTDEGSEPFGHHDWDDDSITDCPDCGFTGELKDFRGSDFVNVRFARKPMDLEYVQAAARNSDGDVYRTKVIETVTMSEAEYDAFTSVIYKDRDWLAGKGGWLDNDTRAAIKVVAPNREALFIDPSGYNYPRYVGLAV